MKAWPHGNYGAKLKQEKNDIINFYQNKRVLITGHTGFKGGWLSLFLKKMGSEVFGISLDRKNKSIESGFNPSILEQEILTDINNVDSYINNISKFKPNLVFYLAAQPLVIEAYNNPVETIKTNVLGLTNFLNAIKGINSIDVILVVTSDKVYDHNFNDQKFVESDRLGGVEPYGVSKAMQEVVGKYFYQSYFKSMNKKIITVRAGNVIGGGDWGKDRLLVDIIKSIDSKQKMLIRYPKNTRPWQHVIELLYGYLTLVSKVSKDDIGFESFNFAPEKSYPAEDIIKLSKKYWGNKFDYIISDKNHIFEEKKLEISNKKIENYINWKVEKNLSHTLKETFDWYNDFLNKENMVEVNNKVIDKCLGIIK